MGCRRLLCTLLTTGLVLLPAPARAEGEYTGYPAAYWRMNEEPGATRMIDSSGNRLHGRIGDEVGTGLMLGDDIGYRFERLEPDTPPARPGHLVTVPDDSSLDPGTNDFAVTVRLRTTNKFGNIIQKGQATVSGGNFKLQIPSGRVECTFRGPKGFLEVIAPFSINDGEWHEISCTRYRAGVELVIDGRQVATRAGWTGPIANAWPVSIGGKLDCDQVEVGCDYYAGDLGYIVIESVPPQQW
ncbi:laminin G domain-containing protein [Actinoplanes sp. DH11]|uniref:laminin G domain-containing protein n=1 Tax=Actinoplanes sp. DH11 TaxID=2857011 RepID=UPI001E5AB278|nr:laminin G domain-containing protein [Actinoplanes sp. DH11]